MSTTYKNLVKTFIESYYRDKELALLKEALDVYFACRDSIPAIDKNGMLDFDKLENKNRLINNSEVFGYALHEVKEDAEDELKIFKTDNSLKFYTNQYGINKVLSKTEIKLIELLNNEFVKTKDLKKAKENLRKNLLRKLDKINNTVIKPLKANIRFSNASRNYSNIENKEIAYKKVLSAFNTKKEEIQFVTDPKFSFEDIHDSQSTVFKAKIPELNYLQLNKTFDNQPYELKQILYEYQQKHNSQKSVYDFLNDKYIETYQLDFSSKTGFEIYKEIEKIQRALTNETSKAASLSLLSNKIYGAYDDKEKLYIIFDSRLITNISLT